MGKLVLVLADGTTLDIPLDRDRVTVGRRAGNDVCLPYPAVSGSHAAFVTGPTGVVLEDLGSTNGTIVNEKRTAKQILRPGDLIDIGRQKFVYLADIDAVVPSLGRGESVGDRFGDEAGEQTGEQTGDEAGVAGMAPAVAAASPGVVPADVPIDDSPAPGPTGVPAATMPAAKDESWLSPPGRDGSPVVLNHAARSANGDVPNGIAGRDSQLPASSPVPSGPVLKVLTGPNAGRALVLTKGESMIGRVGVLVVAVRRDDSGYRLSVAEGDGAPRVNGVPVPTAGAAIQTGDSIEVAGTRLAFLEGADSPRS